MKKLLTILSTLLLLTSQVGGQWQVGNRNFGRGTYTWSHRASQSGYNDSSSSVSTLTVTLTANPTTSDLVVCGLAFPTAISGLTLSDSASNGYAITGGSPHHSIVYSYVAYLLSAPGTATKSLVATWTTASAVLINCDEFVDSTPGHQAYDSTAGDAFQGTGTGSGTTLNAPTFTPSTAGELAYGFVLTVSGTITAPTTGATLGSWTGSTVDSLGSGAEYALSVSSATAAQYTDSASSANYDATIAGFKP
jgi:hypothetical protein